MQSLVIYNKSLKEVKAKPYNRTFLSLRLKTFNILNNLLSGRKGLVFYTLDNYTGRYIRRVALLKRHNVDILIIK
jgi:uncharacterized protein YqjF (DUF2071 family)